MERYGLVRHTLRGGLVPGEARGEAMTTWGKDVQVAARGLLRRPGFTVTIVGTLALGVGATTALFGVFRAVFLAPIDLPDSEDLVVVMETGSFGCCGPASGPDYLDWVERSRSFEGLAALSPGWFNLTSLEEAERLYATRVTTGAFGLLGVEAELGRTLLPEDEANPGVVVLSHGLWERAFGGRADVLGETLQIAGSPYSIVGVMPRGFDVPSPWGRTRRHEVYVPLTEAALGAVERGSHSYPVIARLADGVDPEAAQADMERVMRELALEHPRTNAERSVRVFRIHEYLYGSVGRQLAMMLAAAGLVLLIACGNVAGLQLARAAGREPELAVRRALGASRLRLVRLLFSESLLLSALAGGGGVLVAVLAVGRLRSVLPPTIPRVGDVAIDAPVLLFALGAAMLTALLFGMLPALVSVRTDVASGVREGGGFGLAPGKERVRDGFIIGQIALGLVLANGAALLVQSYAALKGQEYGFDAEGTLTLALSASGPGYRSLADRHRFYEEVAQRVGEVPGVRAAGVVSKLPLSGGTNGNIQVAGQPPRSSEDDGPLVEVSSVTGDYFAAMGIPLLAGRTLEPGDSASAAVGVLVNRRMADEVWPGQDPVGKRFAFGDASTWLTVVGVVGDVRQWGVEREVLPETYLPFQQGWSSGGYVVARAVGDPMGIVGAVRRAIRGVDPMQPASEVMSMSARMEDAFAQRRFYTTLIGLFAVAAIFLAAAGIHGTVSYFVASRVRELGIRMALGAGSGGIVRLVVRRAARLALWGVGLGLVGVRASTSTVESLVYGIGPIDALTLVGGCLLLAGVALAAAALPALRAARVPPALSLGSG